MTEKKEAPRATGPVSSSQLCIDDPTTPGRRAERDLTRATDSEIRVAGAVLHFGGEAVRRLAACGLEAEHFFDLRCAAIVSAAFAVDESELAEHMTHAFGDAVGLELARRGELAACGGLAGLSELVTVSLCPLEAIELHAAAVRDAWRRRQVAVALSRAAVQAETEDLALVVRRAWQRCREIAGGVS